MEIGSRHCIALISSVVCVDLPQQRRRQFHLLEIKFRYVWGVVKLAVLKDQFSGSREIYIKK